MKEHFLELLRRASTVLPDDVLAAVERGRDAEAPGSPARSALDTVIANCALARETSRPVCQDTGTNIWYVRHPQSVSQIELERDIVAATRAATKKSYLRPNAVDSVTGKNSGDNTGRGAPVIHFHQWKKAAVVADVMLKGGGSENVSCQYSLPSGVLGAGRDLEGVRRVLIDAVFQAQGMGCGPGIIGVGVGGDRATSMIEAKEQLFRLVGDRNPDAQLDALEKRVMAECNELGVGPMGFGGRTTLMGARIGVRHRLPASFFVSIAYMCWACRRASVRITGGRVTFSQVAEIAKRYELPAQKAARKGGLR